MERQRRIAIANKAKAATLNAELEKAGYGPDNFSIPANPSGNPHSATSHFACDCAMDAGMLAIIKAEPSVKIEDVGALGQPERLKRGLANQGLKPARNTAARAAVVVPR